MMIAFGARCALRRRARHVGCALVVWGLTGLAGGAEKASTYAVNPDCGNSTLTAVFDAPFGERISAVSSAISCSFELKEAQVAAGSCSVPLTSLSVDSNETKTEHFQEWATNKKSEPASCSIQVALKHVKLEKPLAAKLPVAFSAEGEFSFCGRKREAGKLETVTGQAMLLPAGSYGAKETIRIRAQIVGFDREAYGVGPGKTEGWLARVQDLANVVAARGDIELNLFAVLEDQPQK